MPKSKIITQEKPATPISNRQQIEDRLEEVLAELKPLFGEKKYKRRIKEAGKVIGSGLKKRLKISKAALKLFLLLLWIPKGFRHLLYAQIPVAVYAIRPPIQAGSMIYLLPCAKIQCCEVRIRIVSYIILTLESKRLI